MDLFGALVFQIIGQQISVIAATPPGHRHDRAAVKNSGNFPPAVLSAFGDGSGFRPGRQGCRLRGGSFVT
jgi:hypothetical protein